MDDEQTMYDRRAHLLEQLGEATLDQAIKIGLELRKLEDELRRRLNAPMVVEEIKADGSVVPFKAP